MKTDVLSDVLRAVRLTGAAYFDFELSSPWVREAPPARELAGLVMPGAQRVIEYHVIAKGACWGQAIGVGEPIRLGEGDVILFPRGDAHVISSEPGMRERVDIADCVLVADRRSSAADEHDSQRRGRPIRILSAG